MRAKAKSKPTSKDEVAVTIEGIAFWITDYQLDTILEGLEVARNLHGYHLDGMTTSDPDDDKAERIFAACDSYARFHRVLIDLRERRGEA